ncbi:MAG: hypothetical protein PVJ21_11110 [Anaerolineales bacterium]|jgi:hypothetical protein
MGKNQISNMLNLTRILFFVNAAVWLVFGALSVFRYFEDRSPTRLVYAVLMIVNALVMAWFGIMLVTRRNWIFFLAILYVALNVVLSITDQFGWIDALILLLNLVILGLLFVVRQRMKPAQTEISGEM